MQFTFLPMIRPSPGAAAALSRCGVLQLPLAWGARARGQGGGPCVRLCGLQTFSGRRQGPRHFPPGGHLGLTWAAGPGRLGGFAVPPEVAEVSELGSAARRRPVGEPPLSSRTAQVTVTARGWRGSQGRWPGHVAATMLWGRPLLSRLGVSEPVVAPSTPAGKSAGHVLPCKPSLAHSSVALGALALSCSPTASCPQSFPSSQRAALAPWAQSPQPRIPGVTQEPDSSGTLTAGLDSI